MVGFTTLWSSSVPARSMVTPCMMSAVSMSGEPQFGQKVECVAWPESPVLSYTLTSPVTVSAGEGIATTMENDVPVIFWQDLQWQIPAKMGSASAVSYTHLDVYKRQIFG